MLIISLNQLFKQYLEYLDGAALDTPDEIEHSSIKLYYHDVVLRSGHICPDYEKEKEKEKENNSHD